MSTSNQRSDGLIIDQCPSLPSALAGALVFLALDVTSKNAAVSLAIRSSVGRICEARIEGPTTFKLFQALIEADKYLTTDDLAVALGHENEMTLGIGDPLRSVHKLIERIRAKTLRLLSKAAALPENAERGRDERHFIIMSQARLGYRLNPGVAVVSLQSLRNIVRAYQ